MTSDGRKRYDSFLLGFLVCLLAPVVIFLLSWQALSGSDYASVTLWLRQPVFMQYLIFSSLPDMFMLFWAYHTDRWNVCRGAVLGLTPYLMLLFYLFF